MLSGSIWDKMILFALQLAFTGVLQQLYNAADVAVLGHFVSDEAMAAVGNKCPDHRINRVSVWDSRSAQMWWSLKP